MIDIKLNKKNSSYTTFDGIYSNNSILIIGKGSLPNRACEIYKPKDIYDVLNCYGESQLYDECKLAFDSGIDNIYVLNAYKTTDYIDCVNIIKQYPFLYIIPTSINFSDKLFIPKYSKTMYIVEYYLIEIDSSTIIVSDNKADLYEDMDSFISDMSNKIENFKEECDYTLSKKGNNLFFVCNNLQEINNSNLILAIMLLSTVPGIYPNPINQKAIFSIDRDDILVPEMIFFKNNILTNTTVENLNNFRTILDQNKIITISTVIKYIERVIDLSFVNGKLYNEIIKVQIKNALEKFLDKMCGINIRDYKITNIDFICNKKTMTGYFQIKLDLYVINSIEKITVSMEVS